MFLQPHPHNEAQTNGQCWPAGRVCTSTIALLSSEWSGPATTEQESVEAVFVKGGCYHLSDNYFFPLYQFIGIADNFGSKLMIINNFSFFGTRAC